MLVCDLREMGFRGHSGGDLWQADQVVECANGGWGMGLDNFRTLCTVCHKQETKRLVGELAAKRQLAKRIEGYFPEFIPQAVSAVK